MLPVRRIASCLEDKHRMSRGNTCFVIEIKAFDMSDRSKKGRRASKPRGQPSSGHDASTPKKRRQRLPVRARLSLDDTLAANDHHPLGQSAPDVRAANRVRLITTVLARLAQTDLARRA